jgi:predicted outer membrane repeat protein
MGAYESQELMNSALVIVTNTNDSGLNSLRWAVANVDSNGTIQFASNIADSTITLTSGQIHIDKNLTISGNNASRIFQITGGDTVEISDLVIANGNASGGGAIENSGNLTLRRVTLQNNASSTDGGAINSLTGSELMVMDCTFESNTATNNGGAIKVEDANLFTKILSSTFANNQAANGGGFYGNYNSSGTADAEIINCTFSGNSSTSDASAIGGNASVNLTNVTITGGTGGGNIFSGNITALNSIIYGNSGSLGGSVTATYTIHEQIITGEGNSTSDPMLETLADNGGNTKTHALQTGSSAINAGTWSGAPAQDQRGFTRNSGVSMGAFEYDGVESDKIWTGLEDNDWTNPNNWQPVGVPASTDDVYIPGIEFCKYLPTIIQSTVTAECNTLKIDSDNDGKIRIENGGELLITQ